MLMTIKVQQARPHKTPGLETVEVSLYWHNGSHWTSKPDVQEYRFRCIGKWTKSGWKLHLAKPDRALPPFPIWKEEPPGCLGAG